MKYPKFLNEKCKIGVPAPSDGSRDELKKNKYNQAIKKWQELGYTLELSKNLYHTKRGRSASALERAEEINSMFQEKEIEGIICATGGEFLVEILPYVDFKLLEKNPKWVVGFSDPTGLLYPITSKYDIATIYGKNFSSFGVEKDDQSNQDLIDVLQGKKREVESYPTYEEEPLERITGLENPNYQEKVYWKTLDNKKVDIKARILGGCFEILSELAGTKYDGIKEFNEKYQKDGILWYFDVCEMSMEEVIRTLWKMKELEYFKYAKGIIFGRFGREDSALKYTLEECLKESVLYSLNIPIIYDADISHKDPCIPIINGSIASLYCENGRGRMKFHLE